jgi:hypothetical protein
VSKEMDAFDGNVTQRYGDPMLDNNLSVAQVKRAIKVINAATPKYLAYDDDVEHHEHMQDTNNFDPEKYDEFILEQVQLSKG